MPGSTLDDAWRGGEVPNPYLDRNSLAAEWVPQRTWLYRRRFTIPPGAGPFATLRFEGLDPGATIIVDGVELARRRGMFVPVEVPLRGRLASPGEHDLVVALDPAPPMPSQVSRTELAREHRSRMGYGWDFCPRMVQTGIWRPVSLHLFGARLTEARLRIDLAPDHRSARVRLDADLDGRVGDGAQLSARVIGPHGSAIAEAQARLVGRRVRLGLEMEDPILWWPNGIGEPALHRLEVTLEDGGGPLDRLSLGFGVRSVALAPTTGAPDGALPYTLVVNGRPTWVRGWNWVPIDAAYGVPRPDRLRHLVELARRANVNLLRVWGGGLIESEAFYEACDRAGILVWQELALSSSGVGNAPPDDADFVELMRREATAVVPLRSRHPSLAIWCGGNELADADGRPLDERHPVLAALREVVAREDPTRAWLPTSPSGPRFDNSLAAVAEDPASLHDVHGPWEHQGLVEQHALANDTTSLLHSEFGVEGMTNLPTLRATVTEPDRWTADRTDPVLAHRGAWWNNRPFVEHTFGGARLEADELARASRHLQADGLRTLVEGDRRRWPRNAGALPWAFNEPFPNAWSNAAVDWFGVPKGAYHGVVEAYAPILPGASVDAQVLRGATTLTLTPWAVNDTDAGLDGPMEVVLHDAAGRRLAATRLALHVPANAVSTAAPVTLPVPGDAADLLVLDVVLGEHRSRRLLSRTDSLEPMRRLPPATLAASLDTDGRDAWRVTLDASGAAAVEVTVADARPVGWPERSGAAYVEPGMLTLLPGERRTVRVDWVGVPAAERSLSLSGWNVAERTLSGG